MGERNSFALFESKQGACLISTWINLFDAHKRGHEWETPSMDVEHRRDRHVDIVLAKTL
ncbi:hypothetical protein D3C80_1961660 [compost metagenome]